LGGGALPGQALVIFDAERGLVSQVYLCVDGHSQEREIMLEALGEVEAGEVWIADRNFATAVLMHQVHASGGRFIVRRHQGNGRVREVGPWRWIAESETGTIEERCVVIEDGFGGELEARSIRVRLQKQTRDGDREIELLTDLPTKITAELIAAAYRQRWRIETAFADLDRVFEGEIESLGHPQAALLAFALALVAYNTLGVVQAALRAVHGAEKVKNEVSPYYLGLSTATSWSSLELFHDAKDWTKHFAQKTASQMARLLVDMARKVNLAKLKKHPRGPKKPPPIPQYDKRSPHFATSRVLAKRK
jgi:IS4 transposase